MLALAVLLPWIAYAQRNSANFPEPPSDLSGDALRQELKRVYFRAPTILSYDNARRRMFAYVNNEPSGPKANKVYCVYGGTFRNHTYGVSATSLDNGLINTEHVVPQSFLTGTDNERAKADIHQLFPTFRNWNSTRNNHPFGEITNAQVTSWQYLEEDANTWTPSNIAEEDAASRYRDLPSAIDVYMPRKDIRGDIARAIFYVYTMYPDATPSNPITSVIPLQTAINWHNADPPDADEVRRNDRIQTYQNTRNPYVDWPEIAARAFDVATCSGTPTTQVTGLSISNVGVSSMTVNWTVGNGDRRLIVVRPTTATAFTPSNGTTYGGIDSRYNLATVRGDQNRLVYYGTAGSVTITGLDASTAYTVTAYEVCSTTPSYRTTTPPTVAATTLSCSGTPATQVTGLMVTATGTTTLDANWTRGNGNNVMIIARAGAAVSYVPPSGTAITGVNANFSTATDKGSGNKIVYTGPASSISISGLVSGTTYHFRAYEYCSIGTGAPNFNTVGAPTASRATQTTCASPVMPASSLSTDFQGGTSITLSWPQGMGDRRIMVARKTSAVSFVPANGAAPTGVNTDFSLATDQGSGNKLVYDGIGTSTTVTGLDPNSSYHFQLYDYCLTGSVYSAASSSPRLQANTTVVSDLFISCYMEGTSNNKAIELYNATGQEVDLSDGYELRIYINGASSPSSTITFPAGTRLDDGLTYVIANTLANTTIRAKAQLITGSLNFNGDDAVALFKGTQMLDLVGRIGCQPSGGAWTSGTISTLDRTLRRKPSACSGVKVNPTTVCQFPTLATAWDVYAVDQLAGLGGHTNNCGAASTSVTTGTTSNTSYCVGASTGTSISSTYTAEGTFNSGNVFTLQLSDATGSFTNPIILGNVTSTALSGIINGTIPGGRPAGTAYQLRVVSSQPATVGSIGTQLLTINVAPGAVTSFAATAGTGTVALSWTVPTSCFSHIMVVAKASSAVTAVPNLVATSYTANAAFGTSGTGVNLPASEFAIYKGTGTSVNVTGLTAGTLYHFRIYTNNGGSEWRAISQTSAVPVAAATGNTYRSRDVSPVNSLSTGGAWGTASNWEVFNTGTNTWGTATSAPNATADVITIRTGHRINQNVDNLEIDQVIVEANAVLTRIGNMSNIDLKIMNGVGDDLIIFGTLIIDPTGTSGGYGTGLSFATGATIRFKEGSLLRVLNNTGGGSDDYANNDAGFAANIIWENRASYRWEQNVAISMSGQTFFPTTVEEDYPQFQLGTTISSTLGGSSATLINGIFNVGQGFTTTYAGTGTKTFRQGIEGPGTITMSTSPTVCGKFIITGADAVLGGTTLILNTNGLEIAAGAKVTLTDNIKVRGGPIVVNGTLDLAGFNIEYASPGTSFTLSVANGGVIRTSNPAGLVGIGAAISGATSVTLSNTGALVEYYSSAGAQSVSATTYYDLRFTGAAAKNFTGATTVGRDLLLEAGTQVGVNSTSGVTLTLGRNLTCDASVAFTNTAFQQLSLELTNGVSHTISGNGSTIRLFNLTNPSTPTTYSGLTLSANTPLELDGDLDCYIGSTYDFMANGNTIAVGRNLSITDAGTAQVLDATVILKGSSENATTYRIRNRSSSTSSIQATIKNLIFDVNANTGYLINLNASNQFIVSNDFVVLQNGAGITIGDGALTSNLLVGGSFLVLESLTEYGMLELTFTGASTHNYFLAEGGIRRVTTGAGTTNFMTQVTNPAIRYAWQDMLPVYNRLGSLTHSLGTNIVSESGGNILVEGGVRTLMFNGAGVNMDASTRLVIGVVDSVIFAGSLENSSLPEVKAIGGGILALIVIQPALRSLVVSGNSTVLSFQGSSLATRIVLVTGTLDLGPTIDIRNSVPSQLPTFTLTGSSSTLSIPQDPEQDVIGIVINKDDDAQVVTLGQDLHNTRITMAKGQLVTGANAVRLGTNGWVSGETKDRYVQGTVTSLHSVGANDSSHFGGIGVVVSTMGSSVNLGNTTVTRVTGTPASGNGFSGVARTWDISPATQPAPGDKWPRVELTFLDTELDGKNWSTAQLWRRSSPAAQWSPVVTSSRTRNTGAGTITIKGFTPGFSEWAISDEDNPLPVELSSLAVRWQGNRHLLTWSTLTEQNSAAFVVERRLRNGDNWDSLGMVKAAGNAVSLSSYEFLSGPMTSTSNQSWLYRLRMVDLDGSVKLSALVALNAAGSHSLNKPIIRDGVLEYDAQGESWSVYNAMGQLVAEPQQGRVVMNGLPAGTYYIRCAVASHKFVWQP